MPPSPGMLRVLLVGSAIVTAILLLTCCGPGDPCVRQDGCPPLQICYEGVCSYRGPPDEALACLGCGEDAGDGD
jgi:hypothetical protein